MTQLIIGIIIIVLGVILTTVGGYVAKDGWDKMYHKKSVDIQQNATGDDNTQAATVLGSNNTVIQVAPGSIVVNGTTDEGLKQIRDGMLAVQKQKDAELRATFNLGYILFTATERNEIVPLNSPIDDILKIDWKSGYNVSFSDKTVTLRFPDMTFQPPDGDVHFSGCSVTVFKHFEPLARPGFVMGNYRLAFKVASINENSVVIAMGIQSPPPPRPSAEELAKYNN
jgi:hypothetical protein